MEWIYSAIVVSIMAGMFGLLVGGMVLRRVIRSGERPRPVISWLLGAMTALALVQVMEQSRVLVFRLSYDGWMRRDVFDAVYGAAWNVTSSKILAAVALAIAAVVKLGLYLDYPEPAIVRWGAAAGVSALAIWAVLAVALDWLMW